MVCYAINNAIQKHCRPSGCVNRKLLLPSTRSLASSLLSGTLHYEQINGDIADSSIVFLHGLLGNGRNVGTLAKKICAQQQRSGIVMDLPGHGRSQGALSSPVGFADCVRAIQQTLEHAGISSNAASQLTFIGHSLGGRLSMEYIFRGLRPLPAQVWLLDTVPSNTIDAGVHKVLQVADQIVNDNHRYKKQELTEKLMHEHQLDRMTSQWLAASYQQKTGTFGFDINVAHDLVRDFQQPQQPFLQQIQQVVEQKTCRVDMVRGARNQAWEESGMLDTLRGLEGPQFGLHTLPDSGHWVHVDNLPGLLDIIGNV